MSNATPIEIPPLNLSEGTDRDKQFASLKFRLKSKQSLAKMNEGSLSLTSDRSCISRTLRDSVGSQDEKEFKQRYAVDPFFRKKMQFELSSLQKAGSRPLTDRVFANYVPIQRTLRVIEEQWITTYRREKQLERVNTEAGKQMVSRMAKEWQREKGKENNF